MLISPARFYQSWRSNAIPNSISPPMPRYLALLWPPDDARSTAQVAAVEKALVATAAPWTVAYKNSGVLVAYKPADGRHTDIHLLANCSGVILGPLFRRSCLGDTGHGTVAHFDQRESINILHSGGRHLVGEYWGNYIAIVHDRDAVTSSVLRDPTTSLACYHGKSGAIDAFFSHLEDFAQYISRALSVSWEHIAARLLSGTHISRDCGLQGIEDVPGGEWITFSPHGENRRAIWHPAQFCVDDFLEDEARAAQELKSTVLNVVHSLSSLHSSILIRLSGGLDSSIVTTCVARQTHRPSVTCINYYVKPNAGDDERLPVSIGLSQENLAKIRRVIGSADEREFARRVAEKSNFTLVEIEKRVTDVDLRDIESAPLAPRPSSYLYFAAEDRAERTCATQAGASACFTGEGGDTVFYATLRAIGALDYAFVHCFGPDLPHQIAVTAALSGESLARVLGKVLKHGLLGLTLPSPYEPSKRPHLMRDEIATEVSRSYFHHPWLDTTPRLCPGKHTHVTGIATSMGFYHYAQHRDVLAPAVRPLASQPVIETCLRIPSYILLAGGISRGLARRAFRDFLPPEVTRRTVKGMTIGFWQEAGRRNMQTIREYLLDGYLVKQGLLDRPKLDAYLVKDQPWLTVSIDQIMDYLGCEAWLRRVNCLSAQAGGGALERLIPA